MTKNCHETAATTAYFWKAGASAIDAIGLDEASAVSHDLFGRQTTELQGRRVSADYHGVVIQRGIKFMK